LRSEFQVNGTTQGDQMTPAITVDPFGGFTIAFVGVGPGDLSGVFIQRYDSTGAPLGGNVRLNSAANNLKTAPDVGVDAAGNLVGVWAGYGQGTRDFGILTQRLQGSDQPPSAISAAPVPKPVD